MRKRQSLTVIWAPVTDPNADELVCQAYQIILGEELIHIQEEGFDEGHVVEQDKDIQRNSEKAPN
jgi:hypothetical protein